MFTSESHLYQSRYNLIKEVYKHLQMSLNLRQVFIFYRTELLLFFSSESTFCCIAWTSNDLLLSQNFLEDQKLVS